MEFGEMIENVDGSADDDSSPIRPSPRSSMHMMDAMAGHETKPMPVLNHTGISSNGGSLEDVSGGGRVLSSAHYWEEGYEPTVVDGKLRRARRYLRTARSLYDIQMQPKRPSAVLKMKATPYGFKSGSTHDVLASMISPIRSGQVLDTWSPLEIGIFEDAFDRFGKDFHAIAEQIPRKTTKDVIAFYYIWKKHGITSVRHIDGDESDGASSDGYYDSSMSAQTLKLVEKLLRRQGCMKDFLAAARDLNCVKRIHQVSHRDVRSADFGLHRLAALHPAIPSTSNLREPSVFDTWTPHEIRVFELAMECFGKEFHQVARMVGSKTCKEVIAFFYVWKKDPHYQVVKSRWEKRDPSAKKKAASSTTGTTTATTQSSAPSPSAKS